MREGPNHSRLQVVFISVARRVVWKPLIFCASQLKSQTKKELERCLRKIGRDDTNKNHPPTSDFPQHNQKALIGSSPGARIALTSSWVCISSFYSGGPSRTLKCCMWDVHTALHIKNVLIMCHHAERVTVTFKVLWALVHCKPIVSVKKTHWAHYDDYSCHTAILIDRFSSPRAWLMTRENLIFAPTAACPTR